MQREKFYNPQSKAYFNCILFVFKNSKILCDQFSSLRKNPFFSTRTRNCFFLSSSFYHLICFRKKTKYTTRCSMKSSTIYQVKLIVIVFKKSKKYTIKISFAW